MKEGVVLLREGWYPNAHYGMCDVPLWSCTGIAELKEFLDEQFCDVDLDIKFH